MLSNFTKKFLSALTSFIFVGMTASARTVVDDSPGGFTAAVNTIKTYLGDDTIKVVRDYSVFNQNDITNWLITDTEQSDDYAMWTVSNVPDDVAIIFEFRNDSKMVIAIESAQDYVTSDFEIDMSFKANENRKAYNHNIGAFAWQYANEARAILNSQAGYNCSSIWALDKTSNQVSLVWYDSYDSYWENYSNPENPSD